MGAIYDESVRLSQTVNDFLDYAKPRQPRQDIVVIRQVLERVMAFLDGDFSRRHIDVINNVPESLKAYGDQDLLYRAFYNILINSQQAMAGAGTIKINGERESDSDGASVIIVEFIDSGPGFDPKTLDNILDPFFTTKDDGTGLGLPIVQSIIQGHNGKLSLDNYPDGGAMTIITLPAAPDGEEKNNG